MLAILCGCFLPVTELTFFTALFFLIKMLFAGILLCATQTPFLYLTIRTKGFVAPLIAIAVISLIMSLLGIAGSIVRFRKDEVK